MRPILSLLLAAITAGLSGCSRERAAAAPEATPPPVRVAVAAVRHEHAASQVEITGTVRPAEHAIIAAKIPATIKSLPIALGQAVKRGDLLVRLTAPELTARLAQATAQLTQAERDEKRNRELAATGADTAEAARAAVDRLAGARAAVAEAEAMLAYTEIRAPYDGRIAQKLAYVGDFASPGQALLVLENVHSFQVETAVPASLAATLAVGQNLSVSIADVSEPFFCPVVEVASAADPATHTVLAKLTLPTTDRGLSGRSARVAVPGPAADTLLSPAGAVTTFGQMERVFVVIAGRAQLRLIKTGVRRGEVVEVLTGLAAGEQVVLAPSATLRDAQPVTPAP